MIKWLLVFLVPLCCIEASEIFKCQQDTSTCLTFTLLEGITDWQAAGEACGQQGKLLASKEELYRHDIQTNGPVWIRIRDEPGKHESHACYYYDSEHKYEITEKDCEKKLHAICVLKEKKSKSSNVALCSDGSIVSYLGSCKQECEKNQKDNCEDTACSEHEHTCHDGSCVSKLHVCDNVSDCLEGSDEGRYCGCESTEFACGDGQCVPHSGLCTSAGEGCRNGRHKAHCGYLGIETEVVECDSWEFSCGDGQCVPKEGLCSNNITKCNNGEDRKHCKNLYPGAAVTTDDGTGNGLSVAESVLISGMCLLAVFILIGVSVMIIKRRKDKGTKSPEDSSTPLNSFNS